MRDWNNEHQVLVIWWILFECTDNIENKSINGRKLFSLTPFSMKYLDVLPNDIPSFIQCISNINNDNIQYNAHDKSIIDVDNCEDEQDSIERRMYTLNQTESEEI